MQDLIDLEKRGWKALTASREAAAEFYESVLLDNAMMLFPGGIRLEGKARILESFEDQPWKSYEMKKTSVTRPADNVRVLTYYVTARREEGDPYEALISSTYVQAEGTWKMALHQQTLV